MMAREKIVSVGLREDDYVFLSRMVTDADWVYSREHLDEPATGLEGVLTLYRRRELFSADNCSSSVKLYREDRIPSLEKLDFVPYPDDDLTLYSVELHKATGTVLSSGDYAMSLFRGVFLRRNLVVLDGGRED